MNQQFTFQVRLRFGVMRKGETTTSSEQVYDVLEREETYGKAIINARKSLADFFYNKHGAGICVTNRDVAKIGTDKSIEDFDHLSNTLENSAKTIGLSGEVIQLFG